MRDETPNKNISEAIDRLQSCVMDIDRVIVTNRSLAKTGEYLHGLARANAYLLSANQLISLAIEAANIAKERYDRDGTGS